MHLQLVLNDCNGEPQWGGKVDLLSHAVLIRTSSHTSQKRFLLLQRGLRIASNPQDYKISKFETNETLH